MPQVPSTSRRARYNQGHSLTMAQVDIRQKLCVLANDLRRKLRQLRLLADLPISPSPPPDSSGIMRQMLYIGLADVVQENVNGIDHPRFGDLGRVIYKKPMYKMAPIITWDPDYIPRTLLEADTELLQLLADRAKLNAKWESTAPS